MSETIGQAFDRSIGAVASARRSSVLLYLLLWPTERRLRRARERLTPTLGGITRLRRKLERELRGMQRR